MANTDKLELILTDYGARRIAEIIDHPDEMLAITKIRIGSGKDNKYYNVKEEYDIDGTTECPIVTGLLGDLGYEFYIYDKQLLEDGLTVSFHTVIPEDKGGFDIREVGLYETRSGEDHLFAISTQQPFVKPSPEYNYFISLNYYIFLRNQNLAEIYDRITLDVEYAAVTEPDLEALMKTFLFAQENLMTQIGKNTELLGYNRPTQLLEKINENKTNYSYITLYKNFASVLDLVKSADDIFSYWVFDYSRRESLGRSITDLSNNKNYLATNKLSNLYPHYFDGFQSMFKFEDDDYYELSSYIPVDLHDPETGKDSPFTMVFVLEPNNYDTTRTLLAKSNYVENQEQVFEVQELEDKSLQVRLFSSRTNYITFKSSPNSIPIGPHAIVLTYQPDNDNPTIHAYINSEFHNLTLNKTNNYTCMNTSAGGTFYKYIYEPTTYIALDHEPAADESPLKYNDGVDETIYCEKDGETLISKGNWYVALKEGTNIPTLYYDGTEAVYDSVYNPITLYAWKYNSGSSTELPIIYTKTTGLAETTKLYNSNYEEVPEEDDGFHIEKSGNTYVMMYGNAQVSRSSTDDITRYVYTCTCAPASQGIFTTTSNPEGLGYSLFENSDSIYEPYTGTEWKFQSRTSYSYAWTCFDGVNNHIIYTDVEEILSTSTLLYDKDHVKIEPTENGFHIKEINGAYTIYYKTYVMTRSSEQDIPRVHYFLFYRENRSSVELDYEKTPPVPKEYLSPLPALGSYIVDTTGQKVENIDSKVGLVSIIKEKLSDADARVLALNLCATLGRNPFLSEG